MPPLKPGHLLALLLMLAPLISHSSTSGDVRGEGGAPAALELDAGAGAGAEGAQPPDFDTLAKQFQEKAQRDFEEFKKRSGFRELEPLGVGGAGRTGGEHVFSEQESSFKEWSSRGGVTSERSAGHRTINRDGDVQEIDFKP